MTDARAHTPLTRAAAVLATWFGCGLFPWAPGTVGSLATWPLHYALERLSPLAHWLVVLGVTGLGAVAGQIVAEFWNDKDPSRVVVDEVAGTLIALGLAARHGLGAEVLALVLFRVLDITKPGFIRRAERVKPIGLGIMLDDVLAGAIAGGFVGALPWGG